MTWEQVAAFRMRRHHLLERAPGEALVRVAGDMGGAQAQLLPAAQLSLWARVRGLRPADIETAMSEKALVKAACMRRTLFLVPAGLLAIFVRGSARRAEKEIHYALGKGVPAREVERAIEAALEALDQPLTRPEIAERTCRLLGVQMQTYHGGGWGNRRALEAVPVGHLNYPVVDLLHLVGARGVVCYGPSRGREQTFVRADAWIPGWRDLPKEQAEVEMLRLYLRAAGPATSADFAKWSGVTITKGRQIWREAGLDYAPVEVEGWRGEVLREDADALAQAAPPELPVRLLPYFDSFLLSHMSRDHLVDAERRAEVYRPQGWIAPVVLAGGRAAATWQHTWEGDRLRVQVREFRPLSPEVIAGIREEAQDLARFLGAAEVDVQTG